MTAVTSPLVAAYLADLERRLADAPAADRLDVLDAVREHLDAAFAEAGPAPSDDDVRRVLADLGSPDDVAGALALAAPPAAATPVAPAPPRTSVGVWVLLVLAGLVAGLLVAPLVVALGIVHVAALVTALVTVVAVTTWVGVRAFGPRGRHARRGWQMAFAVALPATLVAGTVLLGSAFFLVVEDGSAESGPVVVVEE
ncbi:hypothetical protein Cfla_0908 [Cellulomonas flavigena DSM 20109]|uniref:DUF1700 domain-containing protein n=1 Tax=Cellulomonas flavigena (strain ATCC 482 / DSM 20109 / BCRC 11376 / JCM 18109 / NBRC 3775 / NCIMB 8073 / NRS 134) TaxID=446466 RepID=D5UK75_CELFN|nr:hypothetical protein [Cellulomonas flavigena]ADG73817.1 hypothetical protein Cfla_0908 [Cellulomonas flavigena DSM 20109]